MTNTLEEIPCTICGTSSFSVVYPARKAVDNTVVTFRSSGDDPLSFQMVKCSGCGLKYVNPRLKGDVVIEAYSQGQDENFVSQEEGRLITFNRCLKTVEKYAKPGRVLDIGTAGGTFLAAAKKRGWNATGIELNHWLVNWGKEQYGVDIRQGLLSSHNFEPSSFDVVTLWDVLEHVPDPSATLKEINTVLKPGGCLVVNIPDIGSWIAKLMGRSWVFILDVHLFYFTKKTITKLLNEQGYTVVKIKPHFQTLSLGYLCFRMHTYSKFLSKLGTGFTKFTRTGNVQIPYWLGQTLVIAKKQ